MKKLFVGFIVSIQFAVLAALFGANAYIRILKNRLADANLAVDMATAQVQEARKVHVDSQKAVAEATEALKRSGECIEQLRAELRHSKVTAVNEKQGAHTFVYVEADSWVDLLNGEKVPAMRKIAPVVDVDPTPKVRWQSGPPTMNTLIFTNTGYWKDINGSFILEPQSSTVEDIGTVIRPGTGGWNQ